MTKANPRTEIRQILAEHKDQLAGRLHEIFERQAGDMIAAGLESRAVAGALFDTGVAYRVSVAGAGETIRLLRTVADALEAKRELTN